VLSRLFAAVSNGVLSNVKFWVTQQKDIKTFINSVDAEGRSALHLAAENNHLDVAQYLIDQAADVNARTFDGRTPLFHAVAMGHDTMINLLISASASLSYQDSQGWSALHWAVDQGRSSTVRLLLNYAPQLMNVVASNVGEPILLAMQKQDESTLALFGEAIKTLSREELDIRIKTIHTKIVLNEDYYGITRFVDINTLNLTKWKTYLYLRSCVLDYQGGNPYELLQLIYFLETPRQMQFKETNKAWLTKKLLDTDTLETGDIWSSGSHEWLLRSLIVDVLKRSAGMVAGVEPETTCLDGINVDWLFVQAFLRSPTKYLFFKLPTNSIAEGHVGAIKGSGGTFKSMGSPQFHNQLTMAFNESHHITSFIIRARNILVKNTISGKKTIAVASEARQLVDGTVTTDERKIDIFRRTKLKDKGYLPINTLMKDLTLYTSMPSECYSASPTDSESDDEQLTPKTGF
jgi:hypothetical protein